jgi:hypothetical protein
MMKMPAQAIRPLPIEDVRRRLDNSNWISAKRGLIKRPEFAWLKDTFSEDISVDEIVYERTSELLKTEPQPPYDAYQVEALASAVSTLLDRCITYRKDMYSLEELAVKRCLEYDLYRQQRDAQIEIEKLDYIQAQRVLEREGQRKAADEFNRQSAAPLGSGFAGHSYHQR